MRLLAVNHHYYRMEAPPSGIYPITPSAFDQEISDLSASWRLAGQNEIIDALRNPEQPGSLCVITFDDGLKEQMAAARRLADAGLGGLFFVSTAPLVEHRVLDVHKLHLIRSVRSDADLAPSLLARFGQAFNAVDIEAARKQYRYDDDTARQVKYFINFVLDRDARNAWIDRTFVDLFGREETVARALYMDEDDIRELSRRGFLGTHAHSHLPLAELDAKTLEQEVRQSLDILKECGADNVLAISYPYGGPSAVNDAVINVSAKNGLVFGFTMNRGLNEAADLENPLALKRIATNDYPQYR